MPPVWILVALILALNGCGSGTQDAKVYRIGILSGFDFFADTGDGFITRMTELGYVEGVNVQYDVYRTNLEPAEEQRILEQFVADDVDLILTFPTEVSLIAKQATLGTDIPVVFANAYIETVDLVDSVREPGGNITGVRYPGPDLAIKRFELLTELAPEVERIWVPYQMGYPIVPSQLDALRPIAVAAGVTLIEVPVTGPADLQKDLTRRAGREDPGIDAMLQIVDPIAVNPEAFAVYAAFAAEHGIPVGGSPMSVGDLHSVFGVTTNNVAVGEQAAVLADRILKGTAAGSIPVVSAESYLQIDYNQAKALGLDVPEGLLSRADKIIR